MRLSPSPRETGAASEARAFAEHTQWEDLQIVPIMRVIDGDSGAAGYGVFKYLERNKA